MLGIHALGFPDSDGDQDAGQETYGDEEPVGMQGEGAYGKEIGKHIQSSMTGNGSIMDLLDIRVWFQLGIFQLPGVRFQVSGRNVGSF